MSDTQFVRRKEFSKDDLGKETVVVLSFNNTYNIAVINEDLMALWLLPYGSIDVEQNVRVPYDAKIYYPTLTDYIIGRIIGSWIGRLFLNLL